MRFALADDEIAFGQAEGAIPNGSYVRKVNSEPGDETPNGTLGKVFGSVGPMPASDEKFAGVYGYFIGFDTKPDMLGFVIGTKLEQVYDDED
jgi:hypothetical protein